MARRRLTPPDPTVLGPALGPAPGLDLDAVPAPDPGEGAAPETKGYVNGWVGYRRPAPIAQVAGDAAARSAFEAVAEELAQARAEGRLVQRLPLRAIDEGYLVRDRLVLADEEMEALKESLRARGQQTPIEVVQLARGGHTAPPGQRDGRFGLISGWRRLSALRALHAETGEERFATVQALLRRPDTAAEAYLAMVEENEIRASLSHYERARIAARATEIGAFPGVKQAVQGLFASASRARRSKIYSFLTVYGALDGVLRFPVAIPERLGLRLAQALDAGEGAAERLAAVLVAAAPETPEAETAALEAALEPEGGGESAAPAPKASGEARAERGAAARGEEVVPGLFLEARAGALRLWGEGLDESFAADLREWLKGRGQGKGT